jgi:hypothetical protein
MPFEAATKALRRLLLVDLPAKTAQRVTDRIGAELEAQQQADIRRAWEQYEFPPREGAKPDTLYLSVDGTTIRLGDAYHEVKVAAFHRTEWRTTAREERELHAVDVTYVVAVAETAEEFAKRVLVEGYRRGWEQARVLVVLGDGGRARAARCFGRREGQRSPRTPEDHPRSLDLPHEQPRADAL